VRRGRTPTDKAIVEATFGSINTLFCQHVAAYTGCNTTLRGLDVTGAWTLPELQDLLCWAQTASSPKRCLMRCSVPTQLRHT
jgi:hypothetical protein